MNLKHYTNQLHQRRMPYMPEPPQPPEKCSVCGGSLGVEACDKLGFGGYMSWICRNMSHKKGSTNLACGWHNMYDLHYDSRNNVTMIKDEEQIDTEECWYVENGVWIKLEVKDV